MRAALWLLLTISVVAGCLPIPHREQTRSAIVGVLAQDGQPLAGVPVFVTQAVADDSACVQPVAAATTDAAGRFEVPGASVRRWWVSLLFGHAAYDWQVCGRLDGVRLLYRGFEYTPGDAPAVDSLVCELTMAAPDSTTGCRGDYPSGSYQHRRSVPRETVDPAAA